MIRFLLMAFTAGVIAGWLARGVWEESRERDDLVSQIDAQRKDVKKQAKAEQDEQEQQQRDAIVSKKAAASIRADDRAWEHCPSVPARFNRMLNAIGTETATSELAGEMPGEAAPSGDRHGGG